ncbi:MAG: PTS sugar transporter subunit IIA [Balneolaceae bacterium]
MNISSLLSKEAVLPDLNVQDKFELLNRLVDLLSPMVDSGQLEEIRTAVTEREKIMSTGVGKELAIPHGKTKALDQTYAAFALLEKPVEYESIDGKPVRLVFLLVGPESNNSIHIKLLSRISRLMNKSSFRERLLDCSSAEGILEVFQSEEERFFQE